MEYTKEVNNFEKALSLTDAQVNRLKRVIASAYDQNWHRDGPNIDQMNAAVAPHILTQEEAFYVATVMVSDVLGQLIQSNRKF